MIEDIFLSYANIPASNNPEFFQTFFKTVKKNIVFDFNGVEEILPLVSELTKINNINDFINLINEKGANLNSHNHRVFHLAVSTIRGNRMDYYPIRELWEEKKLLDEDIVKGMEREPSGCRCRQLNNECRRVGFCEGDFIQKCYDCFHLEFRHMLINDLETLE